MTNFRDRRLLSMTITLSALGLTLLALQSVRNRLGDEATLTGWTLLASTAGLYLLTVRKKLIRRRLGPVAGWLQMHVYMGSFASIIFFMHIGWPVRGIFESVLAGSFLFVAVTGIVLGYLSRTTPRRLGALTIDNHQDQIPALQGSVAGDAHELALSSTALGEGATLAEFYQRRLLKFFRTPRGFWFCMLPSGVRRRQLLRELGDLDRYLGTAGVGNRQSMSAMVTAKDDLDYQYALQYRLKFFFLMHVSMTWSLALMIAVHVVLVLRFQGSFH